jgi:hypothetical protein
VSARAVAEHVIEVWQRTLVTVNPNVVASDLRLQPFET